MLTYKGYHGLVTFDDEEEIFHGEVCGLKDVITFQGTTPSELKTAFRDSIDDYLEFCAERGEDPDKAFSGNFVIRMKPSLHRQLYELSSRDKKSLNVWVNRRLEKAIKEELLS